LLQVRPAQVRDLTSSGIPQTDPLAFSSLQQRPLERPSLINASHITTLCSAVDLYRPKYAVLENVVAMSHTKTGREDQNILSYLVACFISMGYQVNQYIMDSWNYGSGQHRSRVLVSIAAPGMEPVVQPKHTHSRTFVQEAATSLGELANGERFGQREAYPTPFASLTAGKITSDLPNIGNGNVHTCLSHPDHRASRPPNRRDRARIHSIPRHPPGCGYAYAYKRGMIPPSLEVRGKEKGKAFTRIEEYGLIPTICTALSIQDSQNGANIHWSQDRPITILEARRAQGYMDDEPIIGETGQQFTVIGNGVDRKVALAQGLALRSALLKNSRKNGQDMLVDVESEEEALSDATGDFFIDVYVPPLSTPGLPAQQSRAETDHSDEYASAADEPANGGLGLDGPSDLRDSPSALVVPKF
jgi:DNA (cytosine-5)-methyltransferase 1